MKIAFLGTGRMGSELARHLIPNHDVTVWNRTAERAQPLVDKGATLAATPEDAVKDAEVIITSLFGPDDIRERVIDTNLIPEGVTWIDTTTVSPEAAREFAAAVESYVHAPVVGSLGPARNGELGVYVGTPDDDRREQAMDLVEPWAGKDKLIGVESAATAAIGKLLANLALAVTAEGLLEALQLGESEGLDSEVVLEMLDITGLAFIKNMKGPFITGERTPLRVTSLSTPCARTPSSWRLPLLSRCQQCTPPSNVLKSSSRWATATRTSLLSLYSATRASTS